MRRRWNLGALLGAASVVAALGLFASPRAALAQSCPDCTDPTGCAADKAPAKADAKKDVAACAGCEEARKTGATKWCDRCKMGLVKGKPVKCKNCFKAIRTDGWCDHCKVGFVNGQKLACKKCYDVAKAGKSAWCEKCNAGVKDGKVYHCKECFDAGKPMSCTKCKAKKAEKVGACCPAGAKAGKGACPEDGSTCPAGGKF